MTTATQTAIRIDFYAGNLIDGCDQATQESINLDATTAAYKALVAAALPEYDITWNDLSAATGRTRIVGPDGYNLEGDERESIDGVMERVFADGEFWIVTPIFLGCQQEDVSKAILAEIKGSRIVELIGRYEHPQHPGNADWMISLYKITFPTWATRVAATNGNPVWEELDSQVFANMLDEYEIH